MSEKKTLILGRKFLPFNIIYILPMIIIVINVFLLHCCCCFNHRLFRHKPKAMSVHEPFYNFFSLALSLLRFHLNRRLSHFFFENIHSIWLSSGHKMSFVVDKMSERVWRFFIEEDLKKINLLIKNGTTTCVQLMIHKKLQES